MVKICPSCRRPIAVFDGLFVHHLNEFSRPCDGSYRQSV